MAVKAKAKPEADVDEKKRPDWVIRARQAEGSDFYVSLGAGWTRTNEKGEEFISLNFNTLPAGGLRSCLLMRPLERD